MIYAGFEDILNEMPLGRLAEYVADGDDYAAMMEGERPPAPLLLVDNALKAASELINGYVKKRYPAISEPPEMLKKVCTVIAISYLLERKHAAVPEICSAAQASRAEQVKLLEAIGKGVISIGIETEQQESSGFKMKVAERKPSLSTLFE